MNQSSNHEGFASLSSTACLGGGLCFRGGGGTLTPTMQTQLHWSPGLRAHIKILPPGSLTPFQPGSQ